MVGIWKSICWSLVLAGPLWAQEAQQSQEAPGLKRHGEPNDRAQNAVDEDWPGFLGARRDGSSRETHLLDHWEAAGPKLLWEYECGSGFASPAVATGLLVLTQRIGDEEVIDCLQAATGERLWRKRFACHFVGEFIDDHGPRSSPQIDGERVYVHGVAGVMRCFNLLDGSLVWEADWAAEFGLPGSFFGVVSSPLIHGELLIQNLGEPKKGSVAAFEKRSGKLLWKTAPREDKFDQWGASCSSPVLGEWGGETRLFVLTGGKSRPPQGGLMVLDPKTGKLDFSYAFRSRTYYSVNGTSPLVVGDRVLLSSSYGVGSHCLERAEEGAESPLKMLWSERRRGLQFGNPIHIDGKLYLPNGAPGGVGSLGVLDLASGELKSELFLEHSSKISVKGEVRQLETSSGEASLLLADGKLFCLGDDGTLFVLNGDGKEPRVLAAAALFHARWTWTPPVIVEGLLYVRQNQPDMYSGAAPRLLCYDLRAGQ
jgi:outer membrane protein assembly factor BamB